MKLKHLTLTLLALLLLPAGGPATNRRITFRVVGPYGPDPTVTIVEPMLPAQFGVSVKQGTGLKKGDILNCQPVAENVEKGSFKVELVCEERTLEINGVIFR